MSILVVGSTALDSIKTPKLENPKLLGGSASHAAVAASFYAPVNLVGIVGEDFPKKYIKLYEKHGINLAGLDVVPGKTFHWSGEYEVNMNNRNTLLTELGVFETFNPTLPPAIQKSPYVLLANIAPALQMSVLNQMKRPKFVAADTMDLWLNIAKDDLIKLLKRIDLFVLNDSEAKLLTQDDNLVTALKKIHKLGPKYVIIKKGEHGSLVSTPKGLFIAPAYPLSNLLDPTGAGDTFVGAMMGYLASQKGSVDSNLRRAVIHGAALASYCCEGFGLNRTTKVKKEDINKRVKELEKLAAF